MNDGEDTETAAPSKLFKLEIDYADFGIFSPAAAAATPAVPLKN